MGNYFLTLRGTGEQHYKDTTMLGLVAKELDAEWVDVDYPASIAVANHGFHLLGDSLQGSKEVGAANLVRTAEAIRSKDPNARMVAAGYSLGCMALNEALPHLGRANIRRVVQVANPERHPASSHGAIPFGHGVAGIRDFRGMQYYDIANPTDGIASLHPKSPVRELVPWLYALSFGDIPRWLHSVLRALQEELLRAQPKLPWQPWDDAEYRDAVFRAPNDVLGYAIWGEHTYAYGQKRWMGGSKTGIELAADLANEVF